MPCFLQRRFGLVMAMSVALALLSSPVPAEGQLNIVAKFEDADLGLDVVTYTNPDVTASESRVALLGFRSRSVRTSMGCVCRKLDSAILVMKSAEDRL
jgi:hypothetical protein